MVYFGYYFICTCSECTCCCCQNVLQMLTRSSCLTVLYTYFIFLLIFCLLSINYLEHSLELSSYNWECIYLFFQLKIPSFVSCMMHQLLDVNILDLISLLDESNPLSLWKVPLISGNISYSNIFLLWYYYITRISYIYFYMDIYFAILILLSYVCLYFFA